MSKNKTEPITTQEAADILGVSAQQIRGLCKRGEIKGEKSRFGASWLVDAASVREYAARPERRGRKPKAKP